MPDSTTTYTVIAHTPHHCTASAQVQVVVDPNIWIGGAAGIWENPANWSCGFIPNEKNEVIIDNRGGPVNITISQHAKCKKGIFTTGVHINILPGGTLTILQ